MFRVGSERVKRLRTMKRAILVGTEVPTHRKTLDGMAMPTHGVVLIGMKKPTHRTTLTGMGMPTHKAALMEMKMTKRATFRNRANAASAAAVVENRMHQTSRPATVLTMVRTQLMAIRKTLRPAVFSRSMDSMCQPQRMTIAKTGHGIIRAGGSSHS
jgi:hypothetical protein